jgi:thioredoxin 1
MSELLLTSQDFDAEVVKSQLPVVVDFYADWCGPCKMMGPVLHQIAEKLAGKLKVGKFDIDAGRQIASDFGISSIPCLILFKDGKEADRIIGFRPQPEIEKWIAKFI